jgi:hypothetical protein
MALGFVAQRPFLLLRQSRLCFRAGQLRLGWCAGFASLHTEDFVSAFLPLMRECYLPFTGMSFVINSPGYFFDGYLNQRLG